MIKCLALLSILILSLSNSNAFELSTFEKLQNIIKTGKYAGEFNSDQCKFEFSIINDKAILVVSNNLLELSHELNISDDVFYQNHRGNFVAQKFTRTSDSTIYTVETFRIFKPSSEDSAYVVIEKDSVNNRETIRKTVECIF